jgi:hypothetical protein
MLVVYDPRYKLAMSTDYQRHTGPGVSRRGKLPKHGRGSGNPPDTRQGTPSLGLLEPSIARLVKVVLEVMEHHVRAGEVSP